MTRPTTGRLTTPALLGLWLGALALLAGCTVGARSGRRMAPGYDTAGQDSGGPGPASGTSSAPSTPTPTTASAESPVARPNPDRIPGTPSIRVVWEALTVERARSDASPFRRP